MIRTIALASLMLYCPHPADPNVNLIRSWAYQVSPTTTVEHTCPPGLCEGGLPGAPLFHNYIQIPMDLIDLGGGHHALDLEDVAAGGFIMFGVQYSYNDGTCGLEGECTDVWWNVTQDINAPCVCPDGGC